MKEPGGVVKESAYYIWSIIRHFLLGLIGAAVISGMFLYLYGPIVDNAELKEIDTSVFANYQNFDYTVYDNKVFMTFRHSFDYNQKNKLLSDDVTVNVEIFDENVFSKKGKVKSNVLENKDRSYSNTVIVEKNNVRIFAIEHTDTKNSEAIQDSILYVVSQFEKN